MSTHDSLRLHGALTEASHLEVEGKWKGREVEVGTAALSGVPAEIHKHLGTTA